MLPRHDRQALRDSANARRVRRLRLKTASPASKPAYYGSVAHFHLRTCFNQIKSHSNASLYDDARLYCHENEFCSADSEQKTIAAYNDLPTGYANVSSCLPYLFQINEIILSPASKKPSSTIGHLSNWQFIPFCGQQMFTT